VDPDGGADCPGYGGYAVSRRETRTMKRAVFGFVTLFAALTACSSAPPPDPPTPVAAPKEIGTKPKAVGDCYPGPLDPACGGGTSWTTSQCSNCYIYYTEVDSDGCGNMCEGASWSAGELCCPSSGGGGSCPYGPCNYNGTYYDCCPIYPGNG
jgi:hypothetical protein